MHVFQGFVNEYPDVKIEQLVNVLLTRGDVSKGEARQVFMLHWCSNGSVSVFEVGIGFFGIV